jgi:hypothetical protein
VKGSKLQRQAMVTKIQTKDNNMENEMYVVKEFSNKTNEILEATWYRDFKLARLIYNDIRESNNIYESNVFLFMVCFDDCGRVYESLVEGSPAKWEEITEE